MAANPRAAAAPILHLFREIIRCHHIKLAGPLREIGDDYVKAEFRSHLKAKTTQAQWQQFVTQWRTYLSFVSGTADAKAPIVSSSGELSEEVLMAMSPDQRRRMELLREEVKHFGSDEKSEEAGPKDDSSGKG